MLYCIYEKRITEEDQRKARFCRASRRYQCHSSGYEYDSCGFLKISRIWLLMTERKNTLIKYFDRKTLELIHSILALIVIKMW